jgi:hypothetical protein
VHIGFRTSGGRGEYEVVGGHAGQSALDLESWEFHARWPDGIVRNTLLWLEPGESGKPRLRSLATPRYQIGRMMAAMLLLPDPRREMRSAGNDLPVLMKNRYVVTRVGFGPSTSFASPPDAVVFEPNYVEAANEAYIEHIGVEARVRRIGAVYAASNVQPPPVAKQLAAHQTFIASGDPVTAALNRTVDALMKAIDAADPSYVSGTDPLPALERAAGITPSPGPGLPPPDEIGEDEIEVRAIAAQEYRLSRARGPAARRFSIAVREAYGHRCAFCGAVFGGIAGVLPGVDAAHILAWSSYDLDVVSNGIALCKTHHWAFDAGVMVPVFKAGHYTVRFTKLAERFDVGTLALLGSDGAAIPDEWLPADAAQRPSPKYLIRLYEDLSISF